LQNNYPNPLNPSTTIRFGLAESVDVNLQIYNVNGQLIKSLESGVCEAGFHEAVWNGDDNNGKNVSSGIYFYKL
jgi:flagellar hook assembly protein FlgD